MTSRDYRDIIGGLVMAALGLLIFLHAQRYEIGSLAAMGPGFFPAALGLLLSIFGALVAIPAFFRAGEPIGFNWRAYLLVISSLLLFALTLRSLGIVLATALAVVSSSFASPVQTMKGRGVLVVSVVAITYVVFILGLNMRIPVWPTLF